MESFKLKLFRKILIIGDHVIPVFASQCYKCEFCKSTETNICNVNGMFQVSTSRSIHLIELKILNKIAFLIVGRTNE